MVVRRDVLTVLVIAATAFAIRVYAPWNAVFEHNRVNFLETDAWYHIRLIENQVRNWPWRVTADPYAAPGGQFVPIAPLFDTSVATAVVLWHGRDAATRDIERIAAFAPPLFGALAIVAAWALAARAFDRRAGLITAALLAVLPGHFLDRTLLGFVDHHALEALLALAVFLAFVDTPRIAGLVLGLYLLAWASGAFLVAILVVWLLLFIPIARSSDEIAALARALGTAALVALLMVLIFQDPRMHRYGSQILALLGLGGVAFAVLAAHRYSAALPPRGTMVLVVGVLMVVVALVAWRFAPDLLRQVSTDVRRLAPDPARMSVLEARPLFLYPGQWNWLQPWTFFRAGFYVGFIALVALPFDMWRRRDPMPLGIWVLGFAVYIATVGQNRFGYYLVPASALLAGWLATALLDASWIKREAAIVLIAGGMFVPNLASSGMAIARQGTMPQYWHDAMTWLQARTPPPFASQQTAGDYYLARYTDNLPSPDYSVMNWWDHGYFVTQSARRVPVANPTQQRAPNAARFYAATDDKEAAAILDQERSRFVLADWELPFRLSATGVMMGRFQSVVDWAGEQRGRYYEVYYRSENSQWVPVWVFHRPYYESMAYRLLVLGGQATMPANTTTVMRTAERVDTVGAKFHEILSQQTFPTYDAARRAMDQAEQSSDRVTIVGIDPWRTAFPLDAVTSVVPIHEVRTSGQSVAESPWIRIFERRR